MKKFGKNKIALFLACTSVLGGRTQATNIGKVQTQQTLAAIGGATFCNDKPIQQGLSNNQKLAIAVIASLVGITAIGFAVWGVKKHLEGKKSKFCDQNIKIIEEQSGLNNENIDRLIGFIKSEDNSFLDNIISVRTPDGLYIGGNLNEEIIKKAGVSKGNSWVERFFDDLRCKSKIYKIVPRGEDIFLFYTNEKSWVQFSFFTIYNIIDRVKTGEGFETKNDKGWAISYQTRHIE